MRRAHCLLLLLPIVVAAATAGVRTGHFSKWGWFFLSRPILECPEQIDLGEQETGKVATGHLSISNLGTAPLVIDDVQTGCSCGGLEQEIEGQYRRLNSLEIAPREKVELAVRFAVNGRPGISRTLRVVFRTNDPNRPSATIEAIISKLKGGVATVPASVVLGTVLRDGVANTLIAIYDGGVEKRGIEKVISTRPNRFHV